MALNQIKVSRLQMGGFFFSFKINLFFKNLELKEKAKLAMNRGVLIRSRYSTQSLPAAAKVYHYSF